MCQKNLDILIHILYLSTSTSWKHTLDLPYAVLLLLLTYINSYKLFGFFYLAKERLTEEIKRGVPSVCLYPGRGPGPKPNRWIWSAFHLTSCSCVCCSEEELFLLNAKKKKKIGSWIYTTTQLRSWIVYVGKTCQSVNYFGILWKIRNKIS